MDLRVEITGSTKSPVITRRDIGHRRTGRCRDLGGQLHLTNSPTPPSRHTSVAALNRSTSAYSTSDTTLQLRRRRADPGGEGLSRSRPLPAWVWQHRLQGSRHRAQRAAGVLGADLIAFTDALKIQRAVLAGYDWGARTAGIAAALWPDTVKALVSASAVRRRRGGRRPAVATKSPVGGQSAQCRQSGPQQIPRGRGDLAQVACAAVPSPILHCHNESGSQDRCRAYPNSGS